MLRCLVLHSGTNEKRHTKRSLSLQKAGAARASLVVFICVGNGKKYYRSRRTKVQGGDKA